MNKKLLNEIDENKLGLAYSSACEEISAPKELYGKVMDMSEEKIRIIRIRKLAIIATVFAIIIASNAITYAIAGQGWIGRIFVSMDSSDSKEMVFEEMTDSYGRTYYLGIIQDEVTGKGIGIGTYDPEVLKGKSFRVEGTRIIVIEADGSEHPVEADKSDENGYTAVLAIPSYYPDDPRYTEK